MVPVLQLAIVEPVVTVRNAVTVPVPSLLAVVMPVVGIGNAVAVLVAPRPLAVVVVLVERVGDTVAVAIAPRTIARRDLCISGSNDGGRNGNTGRDRQNSQNNGAFHDLGSMVG